MTFTRTHHRYQRIQIQWFASVPLMNIKEELMWMISPHTKLCFITRYGPFISGKWSQSCQYNMQIAPSRCLMACVVLGVWQLPPWYVHLQYAATFLTHANSALNPIIYTCFNDNFRKGTWVTNVLSPLPVMHSCVLALSVSQECTWSKWTLTIFFYTNLH